MSKQSDVDHQLSLLGSFAEGKDKNEIIEVLKELFDPKKINQITDLTDDEIKIITAITVIADMKKMEIWDKGVYVYMSLLLSRNRKSRREVIDAIKGYSERISGLRRLLPANWRSTQ